MTPHEWPTQPWFIETGDVHGTGNLIVFTDGSISDLKTIVASATSSQSASSSIPPAGGSSEAAPITPTPTVTQRRLLLQHRPQARATRTSRTIFVRARWSRRD